MDCFAVIRFQCGVPKKGHICPYQPKLKRKPNDPPPETKNASTQVEMDEFLVLRRLNLEIQGFPESYVSEPEAMADMCGAEPHYLPPPMAVGMPPSHHLGNPAAAAPAISMAVGPDDPMPPDDASAKGVNAAGTGTAAATPSSDKKKKAKKK